MVAGGKCWRRGGDAEVLPDRPGQRRRGHGQEDGGARVTGWGGARPAGAAGRGKLLPDGHDLSHLGL